MLTIYVANKAGTRRFEHSGGPIEFGRDPRRDRRQVIPDPLVSNDQLRVEELPGGPVRLENLSQRVPIALTDGTSLGPGADCVVTLPARLSVGETIIDIAPADWDEAIDRTSLRSVAPPIQRSPTSTLVTLPSLGEAPGAEQLARWLETVIAVQRSAASSPDFYPETARAVVELIGLDDGLVLLRRRDGWEVVARHGIRPIPGPEFSRSILRHVCAERQTFYAVLPGGPTTASQEGLGAVVAAPILADGGQRVIGVVYGARIQQPGRATGAIRPLEAQLVQVLAAAVAAGLARLESEARAARTLVQFEQFFSPELTRALERDPGLLEGHERELTVLFTDIRGFSRISERLSAHQTCLLVRDVMEELTERIRAHQGVVVDYIGDALLALWNAPLDQPEHARLACRAALAMQGALPGLNDRWADKIGGPFGLGIGLNSGTALVGNTGSRSRFKYGPLGHTVNLASRVEGATKQFGVPILITGATHERLGGSLATRRLCRVKVVGIAEPVALYELHAEAADPDWQTRRDTYETGLAHFEAGRLAEAGRTLYALLEGREGTYDLPTLALVARAIEHLKDPPGPFDPVLELTTK
ncbi:MAG TPA: adenylate/guanylate cyclase domain-containing protein [Isosphaeraceae bacterium]|jgi:adenylate cyclase